MFDVATGWQRVSLMVFLGLIDLGEPLEDNDLEELVYEADPQQSGRVDYRWFVSKLFGE